MRLAYADPPYPGQARFYPEKTEVNHDELIWELEQFDGWALCTASTTLAGVLDLCPPGVRIAAWIKPHVLGKLNVYPTYAWEPVIFKVGRRRSQFGIYDWHREASTRAAHETEGLLGAKPIGFCRWVLDLMGYEDGDEVVDLFPGTGVMGRVLAQGRLALGEQDGGAA